MKRILIYVAQACATIVVLMATVLIATRIINAVIIDELEFKLKTQELIIEKMRRISAWQKEISSLGENQNLPERSEQIEKHLVYTYFAPAETPLVLVSSNDTSSMSQDEVEYLALRGGPWN